MDRDRYCAYKALLSIEEDNTWSNLAAAGAIASEGENVRSPAFVRELVYGVTENRSYLDYLLDKTASKGISRIDGRTLTILRMGLCQILFMDSVPEHAAVSSSVELARKCARGREGLVNGMLRGFLRKRDEISLPDPEKDPEGLLSVRWSCHPDVVRFLMGTFGYDGAEGFLRFANGKKDTGVRVNTSVVGMDEAEQKLREDGIDTVRSRFSDRVLLAPGGNITETELYRSGLISIQSEGACRIADIADARPGEKVMDMCAAPGGKTLAMAERMNGEGVIYAFDVKPHRAELIKRNAERACAENIYVCVGDAAEPMEEHFDSADLVLADVPCSGLGVIREKPEIKLRSFDPAVPELARIQKAILETCSRYVKTGGRLVYSTCTVNPEENGKRVGEFLEAHPEFTLKLEDATLPQRDGTDGFYTALMIRYR